MICVVVHGVEGGGVCCVLCCVCVDDDDDDDDDNDCQTPVTKTPKREPLYYIYGALAHRKEILEKLFWMGGRLRAFFIVVVVIVNPFELGLYGFFVMTVDVVTE